jgi:hypothetical protein
MHGVNGRIGGFVHQLVFAVTAVALYPVPLDLQRCDN